VGVVGMAPEGEAGVLYQEIFRALPLNVLPLL